MAARARRQRRRQDQPAAPAGRPGPAGRGQVRWHGEPIARGRRRLPPRHALPRPPGRAEGRADAPWRTSNWPARSTARRRRAPTWPRRCARFGLQGREELPVRVLSAGQKRRVLLARLLTRTAEAVGAGRALQCARRARRSTCCRRWSPTTWRAAAWRCSPATRPIPLRRRQGGRPVRALLAVVRRDLLLADAAQDRGADRAVLLRHRRQPVPARHRARAGAAAPDRARACCGWPRCWRPCWACRACSPPTTPTARWSRWLLSPHAAGAAGGRQGRSRTGWCAGCRWCCWRRCSACSSTSTPMRWAC